MTSYQLVVQFQDGGWDPFPLLDELETAIEEKLNPGDGVDGHDVGSGTVNVFIETSDPGQVFSWLRGLLETRGLLSAVNVAYRRLDSESFTRLWPISSPEPFSLL